MKAFFNRAQLIVALSAIALPAVAFASALEVQHQNGVSYATGGVGIEERRALQDSAKDFNLKLTMALQDGHLAGKTRVKIQNQQGETVLNAVSNGPLFLARLQPGTYTVMVGSENGHVKKQTIHVGDAQKALTFAWASEAECCTIQAGDAPTVEWSTNEAH